MKNLINAVTLVLFSLALMACGGSSDSNEVVISTSDGSSNDGGSNNTNGTDTSSGTTQPDQIVDEGSLILPNPDAFDYTTDPLVSSVDMVETSVAVKDLIYRILLQRLSGTKTEMEGSIGVTTFNNPKIYIDSSYGTTDERYVSETNLVAEFPDLIYSDAANIRKGGHFTLVYDHPKAIVVEALTPIFWDRDGIVGKMRFGSLEVDFQSYGAYVYYDNGVQVVEQF